MQSRFRIYVKRLSFLILAVLTLFGGFNWLVNPYDTYRSPSIEGFNAEKPEVRTHLRMAKAYAVRVLRPQAIILGTSRGEVGVDPSHGGWPSQLVYNLSIDGANMYEILRFFQHAHHIQPLKQVLLTLDFFSFGTNNTNKADFIEAELSVNYVGRSTPIFSTGAKSTLFSTDTIISSIATLRQQKSSIGNLRDGMVKPEQKASYVKAKGHHAWFITTAIEYATSHYLPGGYNYTVDSAGSPFTYYRKILQIAYRDGIDLRMVISPSHVRQWEVLAAAGLYPKFEAWKRALVAINEEEARLAGKTPFPLWDFSVYNALTTEAVPPPGDIQTAMRWYWDSSHYKKELGDLMLDRVFGYHKPGRVVPDDFGVLLTSQNIDSHLQKIRADRQHYRDTHPDDIAEIEEIFNTYVKK